MPDQCACPISAISVPVTLRRCKSICRLALRRPHVFRSRRAAKAMPGADDATSQALAPLEGDGTCADYQHRLLVQHESHPGVAAGRGMWVERAVAMPSRLDSMGYELDPLHTGIILGKGSRRKRTPGSADNRESAEEAGRRLNHGSHGSHGWDGSAEDRATAKARRKPEDFLTTDYTDLHG
jgi:hypothetical protein